MNNFMNRARARTVNTPFVPPAFIVGFGRSGTTLLAAILNRHPNICVTPETGYFYYVTKYPGGMDGFQRDWPHSLFEVTKQMIATKDWDPPRMAKQLLDRLNGKFPGVGNLFIMLGTAIAESSGKQLWIEKTPIHRRYLSEVRKFFPESRILHIVRDGRAVAESRSRMDYLAGPDKDYVNNLIEWVDDVNCVSNFVKNDRHALEFRYEDLVTNPHSTVQMICDFLGVPLIDKMLMPDGSEASLIERGTTHKTKVCSPIDVSLVSQWRHRVPYTLQQIADVIAGDTLHEWGYEPRDCNSLSLWLSKEFKCPKPEHKALLSLLSESTRSIRLKRFVSIDEEQPEPFPKVWVLAESALEHSLSMSNLLSLCSLLWQCYLKLQKLRRVGTRLIWIYHGDTDKTASWRFRRKLEQCITKHAFITICTCKDSGKCNAYNILNLPKNRILHFSDHKLLQAMLQSL